MTAHINRAQTEALATLTTRLRPDWDHPGIVAAILRAADKGAPLDIAHALLTLAEDNQLRSPALLAADGRHWLRRDGRPTGPRTTSNVPCPDHPEQDMPCPHPDHGGDMTPEQVRAAIAACKAAAAANPPRPARHQPPAGRSEEELRAARMTAARRHLDTTEATR